MILKKDIGSILSATYDKVNMICNPLFKSTPISYFSYAKMYDNGEMMFFNTQPDLAAKLFNDGYYASLDELNLFCSLGLKSTLMSTNLPLPIDIKSSAEKYKGMNFAAAELSLNYGYFIVDRGIDNYRICGFGTHVEKFSIVNFYLNAYPLLEKFIHYFEHHAKELIENNTQSDRIYLDKYLQKLDLNVDGDIPFVVPQLDVLAKSSVQTSLDRDVFTQREKECMNLIAQGYTMKNAALKLGISHRTVEQHLRNIKEKHGLSTKNHLVDFWYMYRHDKDVGGQ